MQPGASVKRYRKPPIAPPSASTIAPSTKKSSKSHRRNKEKSSSASSAKHETTIFTSTRLWEGGFGDLLDSGDYSDVVIVIPPHRKIKAHRAILARKSLFFQKLFSGGFKEEGQPVVEVADSTSNLEEVIRYLYTGHVEVSPKNVTALLNAADLYAIECLAVDVTNHLESLLDVNKDLIFGFLASGEQSRVAANEFILHNFALLVKEGCFSRVSSKTLPAELLFSFISNNEAIAAPEDTIATAVLDYLRHNRSHLSELEVTLLLTGIRYSFLSAPKLVAVWSTYSNLVPQKLQHAIVHRLCQAYGIKAAGLSLDIDEPRRAYRGHIIAPSADQNDLRGAKAAYRSPLSDGLVAVSSSGWWNATPAGASIIGNGSKDPRGGDCYWCQGHTHDWIQFDIDARNTGLRLTPTHYVLGYSANYWRPLNWALMASTDGVHWETLMQHVNDTAFTMVNNGGSCNHLFALRNEDGIGGNAYRYFRIVLTGPDASDSHWLGLSLLELFGSVID